MAAEEGGVAWNAEPSSLTLAILRIAFPPPRGGRGKIENNGRRCETCSTCARLIFRSAMV
jgi:hypothetical protein